MSLAPLWRGSPLLSAVIVSVLKPDFVLRGGDNELHFTVHLTAVNSRAAMEAAVTSYTMGTGLAAALSGSLGGARFDVPVGLEYNFNVPPDAGGEETSFVECVDINDIVLSDASTFVTGSCSVSFKLEAFMQNPLPFDVVLRDLVSVICFESCNVLSFVMS